MQLKRNKEMEFETLKKIHKKQIVIGVLAICIVGGALTFNLTRAKYKVTESIDLAKGTVNYKAYDFKIMAMYKSEDGTNYTEITDRMPSSGYVINEDKSYCTTDNKTQVKGKLKTENGKHYIAGLSKSDKCYLYFDKKSPENITELIASLDVKTTTDFSKTATTDEGVYAVSDGMYGGTSYYWRGAVTNNYVKFAGFCWRIVRINGDGTIRLIYDGTTCHQNGESTTDSIAVSNVAYNTNTNQSNYVEWTYEGQLQRPSNNATSTASNAKTELESWYNGAIIGTDTSKVVQGKYCNDRNVQSGNTWSINENTFYYASYGRIYVDYRPTLNCLSLDVYTLNVGLITADEVMFAGGLNSVNSLYYLYNGQKYWTMSPSYWNSSTSRANVFLVHSDGYLNTGSVYGNYNVRSALGLRPVINLKSDVTFQSGGDGTLNNPYVVQ